MLVGMDKLIKVYTHYLVFYLCLKKKIPLKGEKAQKQTNPTNEVYVVMI